MAEIEFSNNSEPIVGIHQNWQNCFSKKEFLNEKDYQSFLEVNIEKVSEVLGLGKYVSHKSYFNFNRSRFGGNLERIDLYLIGDIGKALVEIKYPANTFGELRNALSQILHYSVIADDRNIQYDKICIISPVHDDRLFKTVKKFNLPIELFYITKEYSSKIDIV